MFRYRLDEYDTYEFLRKRTELCPSCFERFTYKAYASCEGCEVWFCSSCVDQAVGVDGMYYDLCPDCLGAD